MHIPDAAQRLGAYPHQLSGGMRQRVMIAMALSCHPSLLIADEPTTALDVTIQAQIVELLHELREQEGLAVLFVTHDLALISELSDEIAVMYAGQVVEHAPTAELFAHPAHPYTAALLAATPGVRAAEGRPSLIAGGVPQGGQFPSGCRFHPRCDFAEERCSSQVVAMEALGPDRQCRCLRQRELALPGVGDAGQPGHRAARCARRDGHPARGGAGGADGGAGGLARLASRATSRFASRAGARAPSTPWTTWIWPCPRGQTLGLVGESGSGKSTVARLLLRLLRPTAGRVLLGSDDITEAKGAHLRMLRRRMQLVFQDPYSSFDPLAPIGSSVGEALRVHTEMSRAERDRRIAELLDQVRLPAAFARRRPRELSGGQLQRAAIARALAADPELLALDEPLSSLDVATQVQMVELLAELQERLGVAYLFISHDLNLVRSLSHQVAVMYLGRIVEEGPVDELYRAPRHPYTQALLSASPSMDPARRQRRIVLVGDIPSPLQPPSGCRFRTRCPHAMEVCATTEPADSHIDGLTVRCHLVDPRKTVEIDLLNRT